MSPVGRVTPSFQHFPPMTAMPTRCLRFSPLILALGLLCSANVSRAELVAHWPLDGDADDALGNYDGQASGGVVFGADGAAGHTGSAAEFNGSSATITVPHSDDLNPASFTLSLWANADSTGGFASPVTSRDDTSSSVHGYIIYNDSGGNWNFWTGGGGPSGSWQTLAGPAVQTGSWAHLAITYSAATQTKRLYVNGALEGTSSGAGLYSESGPQTEPLNIGSGADNGSQFHFDGLIDDVALWDEALTQSEIQGVMNNGVPGGPPTVSSFTASPPFIDSGQGVTLSWQTSNATSVSISPGVGTVALSGNTSVSPTETTTYTLTATGDSPPATTAQITVGVDVESLPPRINEFLADNESVAVDGSGRFFDWCEIYNPNPFAMDIGGWHLTDDPLDLEKYTIPPQQIAAGGYLVLFATNEPGEVNFQIAKGGGYLGLSDPDGNVVHEFAPDYPPQFDDVSYGTASDSSVTYLVPTPGAANGAPRSEIGPAVDELTENPPRPHANQALTVSAKITPRIGAVSGATLFYRIGFGSEQSLAMAAEANDFYRATIPGSAYDSGDMVRWYVVATTATGETTREPPFPDPTESAEYFGTVITELGTPPDVPVLNWFVQNTGAADTRGGTRGALYFDGRFYDNIFCRIRGQSTANWPKHKYKFDFYRGGHFHWKSGAPKVEEFNVNSHYRDAYVRENTIFAFLNEAGSLASETMYLWIKRNGTDMGLFSFVEQVDEEFLTRRGIDATGSMYKAINVPATLSPTVNTSLYRKVLRKNEPYTDLQQLTTGINISNADRFDYVADEVNLPNYINVMAAMCVPFNHDQLTKNYYMYRDYDRDEWFRIAWDGDQGLPTGRTNSDDNWASPLYGDAMHTQELQGGNPNPTWQNHLHAAILDNPVTRQMYMRRVRTLADQYLAIPTAGPATTILAEGATARYLVPPDDSLEGTWFTAGFDDSGWGSGAAGFGYENSPGDYIDLIETRVKPTETVSRATSIYLRFSFDVANPNAFQNLALRMRYDDGFVAYLNGSEVARANVAGSVAFDSTASSHSDSLAVNFVDFTLPGASLVAGTNVLAIQAINQSFSSSDMLCEPELIDQPGANGGYFENLLEGFRSTIENDVAVDQSLWSGAGITNFNSGYNGVLNTSLPNRRDALFDRYGPTGSGLIPEPQPGDAVVNFGQIEANPASGNQDEEFVEIANPNSYAVDMSGWTIRGGIDFVLPPGCVVPGNGSIYLSPNVRDFRLRAASPTGGEGRFVIGDYSGHLSNFAETLTLADTGGATIAETMTTDQPSDAQRFLVISEIMYHPEDGAGAEFIELVNISDTTTLDLTGVQFTDGFDYAFPEGTTLDPGARIVVGAADFANGTALSNGGERIKLEDAGNSTILDFTYDDSAPWPTSPDGGGPSLVLIRPHTRPDPNIPTNWRPSTTAGGNPGGSDAVRFDGGDPLAYALTSSPAVSSTAGGASHVFEYTRRLGADDATLDLEWSQDLINWVPGDFVLLEETPDGVGGLDVRLQFPQGASGFARLRATLVP